MKEQEKGAPLVGVSDVLMFLFGFGGYAYGLKLKGLLSMENLKPAVTMDPMFVGGTVATAIAIAGSHLIYGFIWTYPKKFKAMCKKAPLKFLGKHAVAVFGKLVLFWKMMQQAALFWWASGFATPSVDGVKAFVHALLASPEQLGLSLALLLAGQVLNIAIYQAIGADGVYYGFKLGRPVPWSSAFPFNAGFRHPQYVGAVVSQLGVLLTVTSAKTLDDGLAVMVAYWTLLYCITSYIEAKGDNDK